MKKYLLALVVVLSIPALTQASSHDWVIDSFDSDIQIEKTGHVLVVETIQVDFQTQKHGIFRELPYEYRNEDGSKIYTDIDVVSVEQGGTRANYTENRDSGYIVLKIGDPNRTITGSHVYEITYRVAGVLRPFTDYDELYWNATGFWGVPIDDASATVTFPEGDGKILQASCYFGVRGSDAPCSSVKNMEESINFSSGPLSPGEGMTIAIGYTKGLVPILTIDAPPTALNKYTLMWFLVILVPGLAGVFYLIWHRGRDLIFVARGATERKRLPLFAHETIVPEYSPPEGLHPAEIGLLQDEKADSLDVSSAIVHLASLGYITIKKEQKFKFLGIDLSDYELAKQKEADINLRKYETMLLNAIFKDGDTVKISDLKNTFYKDLVKIKKELYEEGTRRNFFEANPDKVRKKYIAISIGVIILGLVLAVVGLSNISVFSVGVGGAIVVLGFVMLIFSGFMSRRSARGRELWRQVRGYKMFIETAEKHRARFYEEQGLFFEVLPYAIVFGCAQQLADAFEKMGIEPQQPSWYIGASTFNAAAFANDMKSFSSTVSNTMASSPSSSGSGGGGFSGGGFGGGGGGSW